jgi:BCD family chlorophyll transporter-like MFS transporter
MSKAPRLKATDILKQFGFHLLPFADGASEGLPLGRLMRLSLFQVSVGMATVLLLGTLNRVMIVELSVPAMLVAAMVALPVLVAPFRAVMGFRSDTYRSAIGWKRVPYLWFGSLYQFGGLAFMPFSLILLSGDQTLGPWWAGEALAAAAFVMTGLGLHMTQTAGLALAADQAEPEKRHRVVALLYVSFLGGMALSALAFGLLLRDFSYIRLIQVLQGAAVVTLALNLVALWKQERMNPMSSEERAAPRPRFGDALLDLLAEGRAFRIILVVALGTAAFAMQDVLLEPYGGEILGLSVGSTTKLTAVWALGALAGFGLAARRLGAGHDPFRTAAHGLLAGIAAFSAVIFAAPLGSTLLFVAGTGLIGLGSGLFAVSMLTAVVQLGAGAAGLALGAWGAAQATATGLAIFAGGALRDVVGHYAASGALGPGLTDPFVGYSFVYHLEIALLALTVIAIGPLVHVRTRRAPRPETGGFGLSEFPT